jgi:hypothetical protein
MVGSFLGCCARAASEVLNFKPAPRLEQIGDKCGQQMEDRKHRTG